MVPECPELKNKIDDYFSKNNQDTVEKNLVILFETVQDKKKASPQKDQHWWMEIVPEPIMNDGI